MKTNREMTDSVLQRAFRIEAERKLARKRAAGILAGALCLVLILGLAFAPWGGEVTPLPTDDHIAAPPTMETTWPQTSQPTQEEIAVYTGKIYFMNLSKETGALSPMQVDMTVATESLIRVRSLKGMSTQEKNLALAEEIQFYTEFYDKHHDNEDGGKHDLSRSDNAIIQILSGGHSSLVLPNQENIADYACDSTGVFTTGDTNARYYGDATIGKGENAVTIPKGSYRIYLGIRFTDEMSHYIHENPEIPLSTLKDTITIMIYYKDGTKAAVVLDVTLDDAGNIYLTMRGNSDV